MSPDFAELQNLELWGKALTLWSRTACYFTTHPFIPNPDSLYKWINHESLFQDFRTFSGWEFSGFFRNFRNLELLLSSKMVAVGKYLLDGIISQVNFNHSNVITNVS